ncbi:MAG: GHKL domain-containing protein [Lachnospiraceae bacterium]|nr:GHKL domain-containing protein [Lachnospiraceae bacterium]
MIVSLYTLFEVLAIIFCLHYLYAEKIKFNVPTFFVIVLDLIIMQVFYMMHISGNAFWIVFPVILVYSAIQFGFSIKKLIINNILWMIIIGILQTTVLMLLCLFTEIEYVNEKELLLCNFIIFLFVSILLKKCKLSKLSAILQSNEKIIVISVIMILISVIYCLINYRQDRGLDLAYYIVLLISVFLIIIASVDIGKHKMKAKEIETELRLHKLYEQSFQNLIDEICARQHEFDNHINTIYSQHFLFDTYEELVEAQKKYCDNIVAVNSYNKLLSKGNPTVLGFLYGKLHELEKKGIRPIYNIHIDNLESHVPIYRIIEILGNLINNAIEELLKEQDLHDLKIVLLENDEEIVINVGNPCRDIDYQKIHNFFQKGYSKKGEKRGYGLYNVKKICEDYNIILETTIEAEENIDWIQFSLLIKKPLA